MPKLSYCYGQTKNACRHLLNGACGFVVLLSTFSIAFPAHAAFPDPLVNTATVTVPTGVTDPSSSGGVNFATDSNSLSLPSLAIVKAVTANADEDGSGDITEGDTLTYT
ncbi:MAG: hypothetical protein AAF304_06070, partial [Pseudomonadota bacterium]